MLDASPQQALGKIVMTDIQRKTAVIRRIENLQLGQHLIVALDDRETAESIAIAVQSLQGLTEHWN